MPSMALEGRLCKAANWGMVSCSRGRRWATPSPAPGPVQTASPSHGRSPFPSLPRAAAADDGGQSIATLLQHWACHFLHRVGIEGARWPSSRGESRKHFSKQREIVYRSAEQMRKQKSTDIRTYALSGSGEMKAEWEAEGKPKSL